MPYLRPSSEVDLERPAIANWHVSGEGLGSGGGGGGVKCGVDYLPWNKCMRLGLWCQVLTAW